MAPTAVNIRSATPADAEQIAAVRTAGWQSAYRGHLPQAYLDGLSAPEAHARRTTGWADVITGGTAVLVAHDDGGRVIGFASTGASRDEDAAEGTGELYAVYVDPAAWSTGVGHALHEAAVTRLAADGHHEATLWVLEGNGRGRRFYERQGWTADETPAGTSPETVAGVQVTEVRYRRPVAAATA